MRAAPASPTVGFLFSVGGDLGRDCDALTDNPLRFSGLVLVRGAEIVPKILRNAATTSLISSPLPTEIRTVAWVDLASSLLLYWWRPSFVDGAGPLQTSERYSSRSFLLRPPFSGGLFFRSDQLDLDQCFSRLWL
jgi:hypothetical protein